MNKKSLLGLILSLPTTWVSLWTNNSTSLRRLYSATPTDNGRTAKKAGKVGGEGDKEGVRRDVQSSSQYFGNASLGPHSGSNARENDAISKITHAVGSFLKTINSSQKFGQVYISAAQNFVADVRRITVRSRLIVGAMKMILNTMRDKIFKFLGKRFRDFIGLIVPEPQKSPIAMSFLKRIMDILFCIFRETRSKYIWLYHWILKGVS